MVILAFLANLLFVLPADSSDRDRSAPAVGKGRLVSISVLPAKVVLRGRESLQQLVVTGVYENGGYRDLTGEATFEVTNKVVRVESGAMIVSLTDGTTKVRVNYAGYTATVPVSVRDATSDLPINFTNEVVPIFSKLGCNSGACHGKSSGQNGFKLSLLGFVPSIDYDALTRQARGRRFFPSAPNRSLLLTKVSGAVPHGGGVRLKTDSRDYRLLARWIRNGMPFGRDTDPKVKRISITPQHRLIAPKSTQQITVTAHYTDSSSRDVTADVEYHANDPELLEVSHSGLVTTRDIPGAGSVMARYLGHVAVFRATVPLDAPVEQITRHTPVNFIDRYIFAKWKQLGVPPSDVCSDGEFLRRVSIDITGTLPKPAEVKKFLADKDPQKREKLVDELLKRPEYASYFALKWGDILRNRQRGLVKVGGGAGRTYGMHAWIRESLAKNKPYDKFVRELLTATGDMHGKDGHPAVGWYNVLKTPQAMVDDTAQVFLGTRIQCAQCHHHPYENWSQDDYWGLATFFSRVKLTKPKKKAPRDYRNALTLVIADAGSLTNPQGKKYVNPQPLAGEALAVSKGQDPRERLADWMTSPANPFFAKALVNRYWAHFFGRGIVDPPDDMRVTNPPTHPQLLDALAKDFVQSKFDLKHLVRAICNSRTYQLSSTPNDYNRKSRGSFARFTPRRLPAEVLLDAIDQVTGSPTPYRSKTLPIKRAIELPDETVPVGGGYRGNFLEVFGKPKRGSACECERVTAATLTQSLYMLGSSEIHRKLKDRNGRAAKLSADKRPLKDKIDELFLWVFGRHPTKSESAAAAKFLTAEFARVGSGSSRQQQAFKQQAYEDLIWALINTKEFQFNR